MLDLRLRCWLVALDPRELLSLDLRVPEERPVSDWRLLFALPLLPERLLLSVRVLPLERFEFG